MSGAYLVGLHPRGLACAGPGPQVPCPMSNPEQLLMGVLHWLAQKQPLARGSEEILGFDVGLPGYVLLHTFGKSREISSPVDADVAHAAGRFVGR
jgi:hypothetical protein